MEPLRGGGVGAEGMPQLVACSATASYRLREELCRLFEIAHEADLNVISSSDADAASGKKGGKSKKRGVGERGLGGIGVPETIQHSWVACDHDGEKPLAVAAALSSLAPRCAMIFLSDDAPLRATVSELQEAGVNAEMLHEAMGFGKGSVSGEATGYEALRASIDRGEGGGERGEGGKACRVLVSTESSARGLDLLGVDCVLLYTLPAAADQYLHLAGRTGRQGRTGSVISLLSPHETGPLGTITRQLGISVKQNADIALVLSEARASS